MKLLLLALFVLNLGATTWERHVLLDDSTSAIVREAEGEWEFLHWGYESTAPYSLGDTLRFYIPDLTDVPTQLGLWRWDVVACETDSLEGAGVYSVPTLLRIWTIGSPGPVHLEHVLVDFPPWGTYQVHDLDTFQPEIERCP